MPIGVQVGCLCSFSVAMIHTLGGKRGQGFIFFTCFIKNILF